MRRLALSLSILALSLVVLGVLSISSCTTVPDDIGLEDGRLRPCPSSPNCVCSESAGVPSSIAPLTYTDRFAGRGAEALESLVAYLRTLPRVEVVTQEPGYVHAVFTTPLMRFRDDVELRLDEANGAIQVRSASRVGHSDLGANRARVESLRTGWSRWTPPPAGK